MSRARVAPRALFEIVWPPGSMDMPYAEFDLPTALGRFGLTLNDRSDLYAGTAECAPSVSTQEYLSVWAPEAIANGTEKARSEFIVTPILADAILKVRQAGQTVSVLSGSSFDVDKSRGLSGVCGFLLTRSPTALVLRRPVLAIVEAKKEDINAGLGQCAAAMVAAREFNQTDMTTTEPPPTAIHGAVTTGDVWRFLRLDGATLRVDRTEYFLVQLPKILGILRAILS